MYLTLGMFVDAFSKYMPIVHTMSDPTARILGFHYYSAAFFGTDPDYLYISDAGENFHQNCPKRLILSGNTIPKGLAERTDTLIQIPGNIPLEALFQAGHALLASHAEWYHALLMAVIEYKPLDAFLHVAARKLANPIAVFNNNLKVISSAGVVPGSVAGTVWETITLPGFVMENFYTPQEIRKFSRYIAQKNEQAHIMHPKNDPAHSIMTAHSWMDGKFYGGTLLVDLNVPFTEGQKATLLIVTQVLRLYFQNHSIHIQLARDKANLLHCLLDGVDISGDVVFSYLGMFEWSIDDYFCIITFTTPTDLHIPIISILDIKQISDNFPDALVTVYDECVVMIMRCIDKRQPHGKKKQQLEQLLENDLLLCCGASMVFNNIMYARYYYAQSKFAAAQGKQSLSPALCFYEEYQADHVVQTLAAGADPRCFCHPGILALWESGDDGKRDLVHCLYQYFLHGKNISAAADAVHVHRNTFIYRLGKAQEILDADIRQSSPEQSFGFVMSCLIVRHL